MSLAIDHYTIELEALSEDENKPLPVRCIATNTDDKSTVEVWFSLETTRALPSYIYGSEQTIVDSWKQQLEDHHYADLIAEVDKKGKPSRCVLKSQELLQFGFPREELRPWRLEPKSVDAR